MVPFLPHPSAAERRHPFVIEAIGDLLQGEAFSLHSSEPRQILLHQSSRFAHF